jgi:hypothetical protein
LRMAKTTAGVGYVVLRGQRVASHLDSGVAAASSLFRITYGEAWYLFIPGYMCSDGRLAETATPKQLAKHIRAFLARGGIDPVYAGAYTSLPDRVRIP